MSNHYRFTDKMVFKVNTEDKTITIKGSYKYEDLEQARKTALLWYPDYTLILDEDETPNYHTGNEE